MITAEQLHACMPLTKLVTINNFCGPLNDTMDKFQINNFSRRTNFLAQIVHESGGLQYTRELASGEAYDTRVDLGNTPEKDGDGERYKGRGLIQITGTRNYRDLGAYFGQDFLANPTLLEGAVWASMSAGWYWMTKDLNAYADMPDTWRKNVTMKKKLVTLNRFEYITYRINGGLTNLEDRLKYYELAKKALAQ